MDIHHVFPKAWCEQQGIKPVDYNSILNNVWQVRQCRSKAALRLGRMVAVCPAGQVTVAAVWLMVKSSVCTRQAPRRAAAPV